MSETEAAAFRGHAHTRETVAVHEAGHAVAGVALFGQAVMSRLQLREGEDSRWHGVVWGGDEVMVASILTSDGTPTIRQIRTANELAQALYCYAGIGAQVEQHGLGPVTRRPTSEDDPLRLLPQSVDDRDKLSRWCRERGRLSLNVAPAGWHHWAFDRARALVAHYRKALDALSGELMTRTDVPGDEIETICRDHGVSDEGYPPWRKVGASSEQDDEPPPGA